MPAVGGFEQVLTKPLSGLEVRQMILNKFQTHLDGDTRLADYVAYKGFAFELDYAIQLHGSAVPEIAAQLSGSAATPDLGTGPSSTDIVVGHVEQPALPPNEARIEHDMPVPVLAPNPKTGQMEEKGVKYTKEQLRQRKGQ